MKVLEPIQDHQVRLRIIRKASVPGFDEWLQLETKSDATPRLTSEERHVDGACQVSAARPCHASRTQRTKAQEIWFSRRTVRSTPFSDSVGEWHISRGRGKWNVNGSESR